MVEGQCKNKIEKTYPYDISRYQSERLQLVITIVHNELLIKISDNGIE
ncbi:MAG: hypothetical protein K0S01_1448 [Herbinix sp.]|jgi:hypothetical protein|nr:hypothetical protein [Herbinix sp.]